MPGDLATERAAGLFARLLCADPSRLVSRIAHYALHAPGSWTSAVATQLGLQDAAAFGLVPGSARSVSNRFMQRVLRPRLINADLASWHASLQAASDSGLAVYRAVMNAPHLASVHGHRSSPAQAAAWSRLRSGSSCLGGHRARRHASGASCCSLCSHADGGTWHVLASCPALCAARSTWWSHVGGCFRELSPDEVPPLQLLAWFFDDHAAAGTVAAHAQFARRIELAHDGCP